MLHTAAGSAWADHSTGQHQPCVTGVGISKNLSFKADSLQNNLIRVFKSLDITNT